MGNLILMDDTRLRRGVLESRGVVANLVGRFG